MNQVEANIRDHVHGAGGVTGVMSGSITIAGSLAITAITSINSASNTEINFLFGVNSGIQYQHDLISGNRSALAYGTSNQTLTKDTYSIMNIPSVLNTGDNLIMTNSCIQIANSSIKKVRITSMIRYHTNSLGYIDLGNRINGAEDYGLGYHRVYFASAGGGEVTLTAVSGTIKVNSGDRISAYVIQNQGNDPYIVGNINFLDVTVLR